MLDILSECVKVVLAFICMHRCEYEMIKKEGVVVQMNELMTSFVDVFTSKLKLKGFIKVRG